MLGSSKLNVVGGKKWNNLYDFIPYGRGVVEFSLEKDMSTFLDNRSFIHSFIHTRFQLSTVGLLCRHGPALAPVAEARFTAFGRRRPHFITWQ